MSANPLSVQTIVSSSANGPFEKSSDDEREVGYPIVVSILLNLLLTMNLYNSFVDSSLPFHRKVLMSNRQVRPES